VANPKLLAGFEELLFGVATWLILLPKTVAKTLLYPHHLAEYVRGEMSKTAEVRFDTRVPPMVYFLLMGILPYAVIGFAQLDIKQQFTFFGRDLTLQAIGYQNILLSAATLMMLPPLLFSAFTLRARGEPFAARAVQPYLYCQCYIFATLMVIFLILAGTLSLSKQQSVWINNVCFLSFVGWFGFAEIAYIRTAVGCKLRDAGNLLAKWSCFSCLTIWACCFVLVAAFATALSAGWRNEAPDEVGSDIFLIYDPSSEIQSLGSGRCWVEAGVQYICFRDFESRVHLHLARNVASSSKLPSVTSRHTSDYIDYDLSESHKETTIAGWLISERVSGDFSRWPLDTTQSLSVIAWRADTNREYLLRNKRTAEYLIVRGFEASDRGILFGQFEGDFGIYSTANFSWFPVSNSMNALSWSPGEKPHGYLWTDPIEWPAPKAPPPPPLHGPPIANSVGGNEEP